MIGRFDDKTQGDLDGIKPVFMRFGNRRAGRPGVRAPIVAKKPGNAGRAKGCRKVETR